MRVGSQSEGRGQRSLSFVQKERQLGGPWQASPACRRVNAPDERRVPSWGVVRRWTVFAAVVLGAGLLSCGPHRDRPTTVVTSPEPRQIKVVGEAEVRVPPDEVRITIGVETADQTVHATKARNDELVARVHTAAQTAGLDAKHIRTEYIEIFPRYKDPYSKMKLTNFVARRTTMLTIRDVPRFERILSAVVSAGATEVLGVHFRTTQLRTYRDKARQLAIRAAKEKAESLASELGQEVGRPHLIAEESDGWFHPFGSWWGSKAGRMTQNVVQNLGTPGSDVDGPLAPGQIAVVAEVRVSFELAD